MNDNEQTIKNLLTLLVLMIFIVLVFISGMQHGSNRGYTPPAASEPAPVVADTPPPVMPSQPAQPQAPPQPQAPAPPAPAGRQPLPEILTVRSTDVVRGNGPFLLIEYSDFECPFCKRFHPVVEALVASGEVSWIYRHLPLPFHETADEGALISECVRIHKGGDAYWTFVNAVFKAESPSLPLYRSLGQQAGLTDAQMDACLASGSDAGAVVAQHGQDASLFGINGTPGSFLLNTRTNEFVRVPGALPLEGEGQSMRALLNSLR